ncbi:hypothetical protein Q5O24_05360 [Eubacteriaceae bacterium ES3]|nr:hypothetical protein Q5O24_05360 [Eubacteriaceae bacterium ES3]
MAKNVETITLNELRDQTDQKKERTSRFGNSIFGGYNKKQVNEYARSLNEELENAEASFNSRLEEYAAMTEMLKQERDQYGEMFNISKNEKAELEKRLEILENENRQLAYSVSEVKNRKTSDDDEEVENLKRKLKAYQSYEEEYGDLKTQLGQLKNLVNELNEEVSDYTQVQQGDDGFVKEQLLQLQKEKQELISQKNDILEEKGDLTIAFERLKEENQLLKEKLEKVKNNEEAPAAFEQLKEEIRLLKVKYEEALEEKGDLVVAYERLKDENRSLKVKCAEAEEKDQNVLNELKRNIEQLNAENELLKMQQEENDKNSRNQVRALRQKFEKYQESHNKKNVEMVAHLELALEKLKNDQKYVGLEQDENENDADIFESFATINPEMDSTSIFEQ